VAGFLARSTVTIKLFIEAGLQARNAELADEKQTIVNRVAAEIGIAILPQRTSRLAVSGVTFVPLTVEPDTMVSKLPLSVAWLKGVRDPARDAIVEVLDAHLARCERRAWGAADEGQPPMPACSTASLGLTSADPGWQLDRVSFGLQLFEDIRWQG
jgi:hypothetical protein